MLGNSTFREKLITIGIATLTAGVIANFIPVAYLYVCYGVIPSSEQLLKIWLIAVSSFGIGYIIQPISFFAILDIAGSYITWLVGSGAELRVPSATVATKAAGYDAESDEGRILATIGLVASVFTSVTVVTIFVLMGSSLIKMFPPFVVEAFKVILPAVFGAIYVSLMGKQPGVAFVTIIFALILTFFAKKIGLPSWSLIVICIAVSIITARVMFLRDSKTSHEQ